MSCWRAPCALLAAGACPGTLRWGGAAAEPGLRADGQLARALAHTGALQLTLRNATGRRRSIGGVDFEHRRLAASLALALASSPGAAPLLHLILDTNVGELADGRVLAFSQLSDAAVLPFVQSAAASSSSGAAPPGPRDGAAGLGKAFAGLGSGPAMSVQLSEALVFVKAVWAQLNGLAPLPISTEMGIDLVIRELRKEGAALELSSSPLNEAEGAEPGGLLARLDLLVRWLLLLPRAPLWRYTGKDSHALALPNPPPSRSLCSRLQLQERALPSCRCLPALLARTSAWRGSGARAFCAPRGFTVLPRARRSALQLARFPWAGPLQTSATLRAFTCQRRAPRSKLRARLALRPARRALTSARPGTSARCKGIEGRRPPPPSLLDFNTRVHTHAPPPFFPQRG